MLVAKKKVYRRSKFGCANCKRLRIKCSEGKPSCKHCISTRAVCKYPLKAPENVADLGHLTLNLNSVTSQLQLSKFQHMLFNFFQSAAGFCFSQGVNQDLFNVWSFEVPRLFVGQQAVRNAVFSLSSIYLWSLYASQKKISAFQNEAEKNELYTESIKAFRSLLKDVSNTKIGDSEDSKKSAVVSKVILFSYLSMHPDIPIRLVNLDESTESLDILSICQKQRLSMESYCVFEDTNFSLIYDTDSTLAHISRNQYNIALINYLKEYIENNPESYSDHNLWYYNDVIGRLEDAISRCMDSKTYIPLYRLLSQLTYKLPEFDDLLRQRDYIALKIVFFYSIFCQLGYYCRVSDNNLWSRYMDKYYTLCQGIDYVDEQLYKATRNMYTVIVPHKIHLLETYGLEYLSYVEASPQEFSLF